MNTVALRGTEESDVLPLTRVNVEDFVQYEVAEPRIITTLDIYPSLCK
jgi:hypothetical protein